MSKNPEPSTPDTLPLFIAEKLEALGSNPKKNPKESDLDAIRLILYTYQEERVITDEELQEWKKSERKILENQNAYKKEMKKEEEEAKYYNPLYMLLALLVNFCFKILQIILDVEFPKNSFQLVFYWPIDFIVVGIYLFYFHGSHLRLEFFSAKPVKHEVLENEDEDWEDSLTSSQLQSRQKALLNQWKQLKKEKNEHIESSSLIFFVHCVINIYFWNRSSAVLCSMLGCFLYSTGTEIFFIFVEFFFNYYIWFLFLMQLSMWRKKSDEDETINKKSN